MADNNSAGPTTDPQGGSHLLRWLFLIALTIGGVAVARNWALSKADAEFEQRLQEADERRN